MKLTRDEPGRHLVLSGEAERLPFVVLPLLLGVPGAVMLLVVGPGLLRRIQALIASPPRSSLGVALAAGELLLPFLPFLGIGVAFLAVAGPHVLFEVDAREGSVRVVRRNLVTGREKRETFPLAELLGLRVETLQRASGRGSRSLFGALAYGSERPNVRVTLFFPGRRPPRAVELPVEALDKREETADFAFRLGAAAGLRYHRVVRSDPREVEVELGREASSGFEATPSVGAAADYAHDAVVPAAAGAVEVERIPPFDPAGFTGEHAVTTWKPGERVRFDKPLGAPAIGCLPFLVAGFLAGPAVFLLSLPYPGPVWGKIAGLLFFSAVGIPIGLIALVAVQSALPRRVVFDWPRRTLTVGGLFRRREIAFSEVRALELRCVHTRHRGKHAWDGYRSELVAELLGESGETEPFVLLATRETQDDPETPYRQALPLVHELAGALGVPRRVVDRST